MRLVAVSLMLGLTCLVAACTTPKPTQVANAAPLAPGSHPQASDVHATDTVCTTHFDTGSRLPVKECHTVAEWGAINNHGTDQLGVEAQRSFPSKGGN
jgi:hypothetical protein